MDEAMGDDELSVYSFSELTDNDSYSEMEESDAESSGVDGDYCESSDDSESKDLVAVDSSFNDTFQQVYSINQYYKYYGKCVLRSIWNPKFG